MHETRLVADLMDEAARRSGDEAGQITRLEFWIGALAAVSPEGLVHGATALAANRWGTTPDILVRVDGDPTDSRALGVVLVAIAMAS